MVVNLPLLLNGLTIKIATFTREIHGLVTTSILVVVYNRQFVPLDSGCPLTELIPQLEQLRNDFEMKEAARKSRRYISLNRVL